MVVSIVKHTAYNINIVLANKIGKFPSIWRIIVLTKNRRERLFHYIFISNILFGNDPTVAPLATS